MKHITDLPHGYALFCEEPSAPQTIPLMALVRPDGTPAILSLAPPPRFPASSLGVIFYQVIHDDMAQRELDR